MALIDCPYCGKDGVSEKALWCPSCGKNVREYFYQQDRERRENALAERITRAFDREKERERLLGEFGSTEKNCLLRILVILVVHFLVLVFCYGWDGPGKYAVSILVTLGTLYVVGSSVAGLIRNRRKQKTAVDTMEQTLDDRLAGRIRDAIEKERTEHLPYRGNHDLCSHICPRCGMDSDYLEHVCSECGALLGAVPAPNKGAVGDIQYQWCPKCGHRHLSQNFRSAPVRSKIYYKRWCSQCGYVLQERFD